MAETENATYFWDLQAREVLAADTATDDLPRRIHLEMARRYGNEAVRLDAVAKSHVEATYYHGHRTGKC